jgi:transcription initiation factor IIE alpha subunit
MTHELAVSDSELSLLLELLEREHRELLIEIRHTDTAKYRTGLRERLAATESMINRVSATREVSRAGTA